MNVEGDLLPIVLRIIGAPVAAFIGAWFLHAAILYCADKFNLFSTAVRYFISATLTCLFFAIVCLFLCGEIGETLGVIYSLVFCTIVIIYCLYKAVTNSTLFFYGALGAVLGGTFGIAVYYADSLYSLFAK